MFKICVRTIDGPKTYDIDNNTIMIGRKATTVGDVFGVLLPISSASSKHAKIFIDSKSGNKLDFQITNFSDNGTKYFVASDKFIANFKEDETGTSYDMFCDSLAEELENSTIKGILKENNGETIIEAQANLVMYLKTARNTGAVMITKQTLSSARVAKKTQIKAEKMIEEKEKEEKKKATQDVIEDENDLKNKLEKEQKKSAKKGKKKEAAEDETDMKEAKTESEENVSEKKKKAHKKAINQDITEEKIVSNDDTSKLPTEEKQSKRKKSEASKKEKKIETETTEEKLETKESRKKKSEDSAVKTKKDKVLAKEKKNKKVENADENENADDYSVDSQDDGDESVYSGTSEEIEEGEDDTEVEEEEETEQQRVLREEIEKDNEIDEDDEIIILEQELEKVKETNNQQDNNVKKNGIEALPIINNEKFSEYLLYPSPDSSFWYSNSGLKLTEDEKYELMDPDSQTFFKKSRYLLDKPYFMVVDQYKRNIKFLIAVQRGLPIIRSKYLKIAKKALDNGLPMPSLRNYLMPIQADDIIAQDLEIEPYIQNKETFSFTCVLANSFRRPLDLNVLHGVTHSIITYECLYYSAPQPQLEPLLEKINLYNMKVKEQEKAEREKAKLLRKNNKKKSNKNTPTGEKEEEKIDEPQEQDEEKIKKEAEEKQKLEDELAEEKEDVDVCSKKVNKVLEDFQNLLQLVFLFRNLNTESCLLTNSLVDEEIISTNEFKSIFINEIKKVNYRESFLNGFISKIRKISGDKTIELDGDDYSSRLKSVCENIFKVSDEHKVAIVMAPKDAWDVVYKSTDEGNKFLNTIVELKKKYGEKVMLISKFAVWYSIITYQDLFDKLSIKEF